MRKLLLFSSFLFFLAVLLAPGCRKEIKETEPLIPQSDEETSLQSDSRSGHGGGCRMTVYDYYDGIGDVHIFDYITYKNGLVDTWIPSYGWVFKMEYDRNGKPKKSKAYDGDVLLYTISFVYRNDKIVKEIWYQGGTDIVDDEVIYTFNRNGQMIKNESQAYDFYVLYTYEANGQLSSWQYFSAGLPVMRGEYTSNRRIKNPFQSTSGVDHAFVYGNPGLFSSDWWYSSEKIIFYDENGVSSVYYDLNPHKTEWQVNRQNYPEFVDYTDRISGAHFTNAFNFENCSGSHDDDHHSPSQPNNINNRQSVSISKASLNTNIRSIFSGPKKEIRQRLNELIKKMNK